MLSPTPSDLSAFYRKLRALGESERYWRIQRLRRQWQGTGYDGRPSFWDSTVPLRERAPCVQSMVCRTAGRRLSQLVFGDRSFPKVAVSAQAYGVRLDDVSKGSLTALLEEIARVTHLRRVMRALLSKGLEAGTVVVMVELVEGQLSIKHIPAEWCTPVFAADGRTLASLCIERKLMHSDDKLYIHKRVIEPPRDCVYAPVLAEKAAHEQIDWSKVPVVAEAPCAFVPALWHRHNVEPMYGDMEIDGNALAEGLEDEVEALDLALSQLHRNALYNGEPQMVRTGVDPVEDTMLPQGRMARSDVTIFDRMFRSVTKFAAGAGTGASAKSPQKIWNLPAGSDAKLLESSGAGATIIEGNVGQLRRVIVDAMGIVLADPEQLGAGELSARALSLMMAPMLAHADDLRVEYGSLLCALLDLALRLVASTPGTVYLATLEAARPALAQVYRTLSAARLIELSWGEYFEPSWEEVQAAVTAAQTANGARPIMTLEESRALVSPLLGLTASIEELKTEEAQGVDDVAKVLGQGEVRIEGEDLPSLTDTQVSSLLEIITALSSGLMPVETARVVIAAAFPGFSDVVIERMVAPFADREPVEVEAVDAGT
jgi:hypothetical protein